jgi:drug/metabolite transporter (DMT)-like permease
VRAAQVDGAHRRALLQIHFCVLLWGFTAILGKLITLPALALVAWRMCLVTAVLLLLPRVWRGLVRIGRRMALTYAGIGVIVALHWLTFYGSIKLANASVAATCIALAAVFVALIEPLTTAKRFDARELLLAVAVIPGMVLVFGGVPAHMHLGIAVGALSALLVAIFGALNKRYIERADPLTVTTLELGSGALFLVLVGFAVPGLGDPLPLPSRQDLGYLLLLAFACTLLPFALSLVALRQLSAYSAQLAVNLEPVYAVLLAIVLLSEQHELSPAFYLGVAIIIAAVLAHPWIVRRR